LHFIYLEFGRARRILHFIIAENGESCEQRVAGGEASFPLYFKFHLPPNEKAQLVKHFKAACRVD
jgi:hypothetical protein